MDGQKDGWTDGWMAGYDQLNIMPSLFFESTVHCLLLFKKITLHWFPPQSGINDLQFKQYLHIKQQIEYFLMCFFTELLTVNITGCVMVFCYCTKHSYRAIVYICQLNNTI